MFREGSFDVVVAAGPRVNPWPTIGVRAFSMLCTEMGLTVGVFGGDSMSVRGVLPLPATGSYVLVEDTQSRIHRIHARAVVRVTPFPSLPDPFPGWRSQALMPIETAEELFKHQTVVWAPSVVILGTGNRALRFGSQLLEAGVPEVIAIESYFQWGSKRYAAWEVEHRRFEMLGGKLLEAIPLSLSEKSALQWEFRVKDELGVRIITVSRVISAGPFRDEPEIREYPPGSLLFELTQTSRASFESLVDGWMLEEELGRWLALKVIRALQRDFQDHELKEVYERVVRRTRLRLKRYKKFREKAWIPAYQGKWMSPADMKQLKSFCGVPQSEYHRRLVASLECFESISCNLCQKNCPDHAIEKGRVLNESLCTGCGTCVSICPSGAIVLLQERTDKVNSVLVLPSQKGEENLSRKLEPGEAVQLLNRKGENLGNARVMKEPANASIPKDLVSLEVPSHLLWEARAARKIRAGGAEDPAYLQAEKRLELQFEKVEIILNGEKRRVRQGVTVGLALFEVGMARAEDVLHCSDGSCGQCQTLIDGVKKPACQTKIRKGMNIELRKTRVMPENRGDLCACLKVSRDQIVERMEQGKLRSPEAVIEVTHVGEGKCRGAYCKDAFHRLLKQEMPEMDLNQWIDWRFPWSEWESGRN